MGSTDPDAGESRITTDPTQIESWARETNTVPVRTGGRLRLVKEGEFDDARMDRLDWDDFESQIQSSDRVVVYREHDQRDPLQVRHREDAMTHLQDEDVEDRLLEGEVVTGTITETAVVERTVVEAAEIESEIVDSQIVDREIVDAELVSRECTTCDVESRNGSGYLEKYDADYFFGESADQFATVEDAQFELEVEEAWAVTVEELEEFIVESRVADVEVGETDEIEAVDVSSDIDVEGLHRQLIGSNLFEREFQESTTIDPEVHAIESDVHEGDRIQTTLTRDQTVEREVAMTHRVTADGTASERTNVQTAHEEIVATGLAERDRATTAGGATGTVETGSAGGEESTAGRTTPTDDDQGKTVVDAAGDEIGVVSEVEGATAYIEPHPSITEKLMAKLGWSDADEEDYAVSSEEITRIDDDTIELRKVE